MVGVGVGDGEGGVFYTAKEIQGDFDAAYVTSVSLLAVRMLTEKRPL